MATVSTYINTQGRTEKAFKYYANVFGTEITSIQRFKDMPQLASQLPAHDQEGVLHVVLPILGGHILMGTDMLESAGHQLQIGNNFSINLQPDSKADADRFYNLLSVGSTENSGGMNDMPWGAYWGSCLDQFGIRWMINFVSNGGA